MEGLIKNIDEWKEMEDQFILMVDANEDIRSSLLKTELKKEQEQKQLQKKGEPTPSTYNIVTKPIDGIFLSSTLKIRRGGYLLFNEQISSDY